MNRIAEEEGSHPRVLLGEANAGGRGQVVWARDYADAVPNKLTR